MAPPISSGRPKATGRTRCHSTTGFRRTLKSTNELGVSPAPSRLTTLTTTRYVPSWIRPIGQSVSIVRPGASVLAVVRAPVLEIDRLLVARIDPHQAEPGDHPVDRGRILFADDGVKRELSPHLRRGGVVRRRRQVDRERPILLGLDPTIRWTRRRHK
jgi:hypothetical protein